jgi:hypothetical protein
VFTHHPVFYGSPNQSLVALCEKYEVTATFSGHAHLYGHYRKKGVHYFVSGGGSDETYSSLGGGGKHFVSHRYGPQYMLVDLEDDQASLLGVAPDNTVFAKTVIPSRKAAAQRPPR